MIFRNKYGKRNEEVKERKGKEGRPHSDNDKGATGEYENSG